MKVAWFYADREHEWVSSQWRVLWPHRALQRAGIESKIASLPLEIVMNCEIPHPLAEWADVVVFERIMMYPFGHPSMLSVIEQVEWSLLNRKTFLTIDDAYHLLSDTAFSKPMWTKESLRLFKQFAERSNGVLCPSSRLASDWICGGKGVYIPNYFDLTEVPGPEPLPERPVVGWGGSQEHFKSLDQIGHSLRDVLDERRDVDVWMIANPHSFAALGLPSHRSLLFNWRRPWAEWLKFMSHFSVGLAPLCGAFDKRRSWIKPLEYALMGVPWVASDVPAYQNVRGGTCVHGKNWAEAILQALCSPRGTAIDWARSQNVDEHIKEYVEVFE